VAYAKTLHELVQWIGICDGNMQEGSFRCDVNVSVRPKGSDKLGTRREIKNLNSFRFMQQAIEYETRWQIETLEDGGTIQQATVLFDPDTGETRSMRSKEEANDYRYFPDPDLLPLVISEADITAVKATMPELPEAMKTRFEQEYGLPEYDALQLTSSKDMAEYFDRAMLELIKNEGSSTIRHGKTVANLIINEIAARVNRAELPNIRHSPITAWHIVCLTKRMADGTINIKAVKEQIIPAIWDENLTHANAVDDVIEAKGLKQVSDFSAIEAIVDEVLAANAAMVAEYKAGKEKAFNGLVGQCMKASKGKANPAQVNEILKKKLA
jgi:aspartyl-tRNA(Asn)/glutamyl-tRNA(Gln) amidotransferase subunit B